MCDPFTLIAGAASLGGSALSAGGALAGGSARWKSAKLQKAIEDSNAELALTRGAFEAGRARDAADRAADAAVSTYAAGNVDPSYGGAAWAQAWSAAQGETDAQILLAGGATQRAQHLQQGAGLLAAGGDAKRAGFLSATSSLLSGAGAFARLAQPPMTAAAATPAAAARVSAGDPWASMRWGYTGAQPSFWHR